MRRFSRFPVLILVGLVLGSSAPPAAAVEEQEVVSPSTIEEALQKTLAETKATRETSRLYQAFGAGMFIAAGADLASTEIALTRPGLYEMNPVQGNRAVRVLTHVAAPAVMYYVTNKIHDSGKPRLALIARIGFSVAYSYVVMHNLRSAGMP